MNWKEHLIIYVDDEFPNRLVFEQNFAARFRVKVVSSGEEALEALKQEQAAAVVTDQRMPGMSGHELLTRVKALYPDTTRIVITAFSDHDPILAAVNEGLVHRYLIKPWERAELEAILRWAIEAYTLGRENSELQLRLMHNERLATLGTIVGAVLHDINQPLGHVSVNVERLRHLTSSMTKLAELAKTAPHTSEEDRRNLADLAEELPEIVRDLRQSCRMMSELTSNLKQFLRPTPTETPATDPLPIVQYVFSVCREGSVRARGRQVYDGPRELPKVRISSTELSQILINLVNNANQALLAAKPPSPLVTVRVSETDDGMVRFVVNDNGPGMSAEVQQKAGTPFFSTKKEGTGLGLVQCRRLVERAGGQLKIATVEGAGTNVSFTVPKA